MKQQLDDDDKNDGDALAEEERRDHKVVVIDVDDSLAAAGAGTVITLIQHNRWKTNVATGPTIVSDIYVKPRKKFSFFENEWQRSN